MQPEPWRQSSWLWLTRKRYNTLRRRANEECEWWGSGRCKQSKDASVQRMQSSVIIVTAVTKETIWSRAWPTYISEWSRCPKSRTSEKSAITPCTCMFCHFDSGRARVDLTPQQPRCGSDSVHCPLALFDHSVQRQDQWAEPVRSTGTLGNGGIDVCVVLACSQNLLFLWTYL